MPDYGLTEEGFQAKDLQTILAEINEELKAGLGAQINTEAPSVFSQISGVVAGTYSSLWDLIELIYNSQYRDTAEGASLDNVGALTATERLNALASTATIALFGTIGTVVPVGTLVSVENDATTVFSTDSEVTLVAGTDEVQDVTYGSVPTSGTFNFSIASEQTTAINWDDTSGDIQTALNDLNSFSGITVSGNFSIGHTVTFAGADGKQPQPTLIAINNTLSDGSPVSITIVETTPGVNQGTVATTATQAGPKVANATTLNQIDTPVSGLSSVSNPLDAVVGRDIETDAAYRLRQLTRLVTSLAGTTSAIRNAILELNEDATESTQIVAVTVFENTTLITDGDGRPGKSFEAIVQQSNGLIDRDDDIGGAIFASKPAGIESFGTVSVAVTDSQSVEHIVKFSRPTEVDIYLIVDVTVDSSYPIDGDDQIKAALVTHGLLLDMGALIVVHPTLDAVIATVPGITDLTIKIGTAPAPTLDDNIQLAGDELSIWTTTNITVNQV